MARRFRELGTFATSVDESSSEEDMDDIESETSSPKTKEMMALRKKEERVMLADGEIRLQKQRPGMRNGPRIQMLTASETRPLIEKERGRMQRPVKEARVAEGSLSPRRILPLKVDFNPEIQQRLSRTDQGEESPRGTRYQ